MDKYRGSIIQLEDFQEYEDEDDSFQDDHDNQSIDFNEFDDGGFLKSTRLEDELGRIPTPNVLGGPTENIFDNMIDDEDSSEDLNDIQPPPSTRVTNGRIGFGEFRSPNKSPDPHGRRDGCRRGTNNANDANVVIPTVKMNLVYDVSENQKSGIKEASVNQHGQMDYLNRVIQKVTEQIVEEGECDYETKLFAETTLRKSFDFLMGMVKGGSKVEADFEIRHLKKKKRVRVCSVFRDSEVVPMKYVIIYEKPVTIKCFLTGKDINKFTTNEIRGFRWNVKTCMGIKPIPTFNIERKNDSVILESQFTFLKNEVGAIKMNIFLPDKTRVFQDYELTSFCDAQFRKKVEDDLSDMEEMCNPRDIKRN